MAAVDVDNIARATGPTRIGHTTYITYAVIARFGPTTATAAAVLVVVLNDAELHSCGRNACLVSTQSTAARRTEDTRP